MLVKYYSSIYSRLSYLIINKRSRIRIQDNGSNNNIKTLFNKFKKFILIWANNINKLSNYFKQRILIWAYADGLDLTLSQKPKSPQRLPEDSPLIIAQ